MGPTGSGKSELAEALADRLDASLLNADAFQVYRGLDVGTGKPERRDRYELLDLVDPSEPFGVGAWVKHAIEALKGDRDAIVVGGTGFYIRALFEGYDRLQGAPDPELREALELRERTEGLASLAEELRDLDPETAANTDLQNPVRVRRALERALGPTQPLRIELPPYERFKFAIVPDPARHSALLEARLDRMLARGWPEEVKELFEAGVSPSAPGMRAIGYREIGRMLVGEASFVETRNAILTATRQYAKRQRSWLRSEPRLQVLPQASDVVGSEQALEAVWNVLRS